MSVETWNMKCAICGLDLPIDAPSHQKYCCVECRITANEQNSLKYREARAARRRQARASARRDRPPCPDCGAAIPREAHARKKYCDSACEARFNNRARYERERDARERMRKPFLGTFRCEAAE